MRIVLRDGEATLVDEPVDGPGGTSPGEGRDGPPRSLAWRAAQVGLVHGHGIASPTVLEAATSVSGFEALRIEVAPLDWHERLREAVPPRKLGTFASFGDFLHAGAGGDLLPKSIVDVGVRDRRLLARRLDAVFGRWRLVEMNETWFEEVAVHGFPDLMPSTRAKTLRALRRWVRAGREAVRADALFRSTPVSARWTGRGDGDDDRDVLSPAEVARIVEEADGGLCLLVELSVVARLLPKQMAALTASDFTEDGRAVHVRLRGGDGTTLELQLPGWTVERHGRAPFEEGRDAKSVRAAQVRLRRLADRLGLPARSFQALRRVGQAVAIAAGGARATVRGVMPTAAARVAPVVKRDQAGMVRHWKEVARPGVGTPSSIARPPPRCPPDEAELTWGSDES